MTSKTSIFVEKIDNFTIMLTPWLSLIITFHELYVNHKIQAFIAATASIITYTQSAIYYRLARRDIQDNLS